MLVLVRRDRERRQVPREAGDDLVLFADADADAAPREHHGRRGVVPPLAAAFALRRPLGHRYRRSPVVALRRQRQLRRRRLRVVFVRGGGCRRDHHRQRRRWRRCLIMTLMVHGSYILLVRLFLTGMVCTSTLASPASISLSFRAKNAQMKITLPEQQKGCWCCS